MRARSTAAASAVPVVRARGCVALAPARRRPRRLRPDRPWRSSSGLGPPCGSMRSSRKRKTLAAPARVPSVWSVVSSLAALVPPRSSVPPGAGNKPKKAIKPRKRAKKVEERYVGEPAGSIGHMHAAAVRRDHDGDLAAISRSNQPNRVSTSDARRRSRSVPGSLAGIDARVNRRPMVRSAVARHRSRRHRAQPLDEPVGARGRGRPGRSARSTAGRSGGPRR